LKDTLKFGKGNDFRLDDLQINSWQQNLL
jgi:hypothetical protein